jgi:hypothetical protein
MGQFRKYKVASYLFGQHRQYNGHASLLNLQQAISKHISKPESGVRTPKLLALILAWHASCLAANLVVFHSRTTLISKLTILVILTLPLGRPHLNSISATPKRIARSELCSLHAILAGIRTETACAIFRRIDENVVAARCGASSEALCRVHAENAGNSLSAN